MEAHQSVRSPTFPRKTVPRVARTRIARACHYCHKRKTRCERQEPNPCSTCEALGDDCIVSPQFIPYLPSVLQAALGGYAGSFQILGNQYSQLDHSQQVNAYHTPYNDCATDTSTFHLETQIWDTLTEPLIGQSLFPTMTESHDTFVRQTVEGSPKPSSTPTRRYFSHAEDQLLIELVRQGLGWVSIANQFFERSACSVRNRYCRLRKTAGQNLQTADFYRNQLRAVVSEGAGELGVGE